MMFLVFTSHRLIGQSIEVKIEKLTVINGLLSADIVVLNNRGFKFEVQHLIRGTLPHAG